MPTAQQYKAEFVTFDENGDLSWQSDNDTDITCDLVVFHNGVVVPGSGAPAHSFTQVPNTPGHWYFMMDIPLNWAFGSSFRPSVVYHLPGGDRQVWLDRGVVAGVI